MQENLLKEIRNSKVEWKELGEVIKLEKGKQLNKEKLSNEGKYPAYNGGISYSGFTDKFNYDENKIIINQGGSAGLVNFIKTKFWANAHCYVVLAKEEFVLNKFLFYFLKFKENYLISRKHGTTIAALRADEILKLKFPLPSLELQNKIVYILDKFTALISEEKKELELRKKQYEFYREKLLSFGDEVERKELEKIIKIKNGKDWKHLNKGEIPVYGSGGIMAFVDQASYDKVSVLIPRKGTISNIFYTEKAFWNVDTIFYTEINEKEIIPKYFYYFMTNFNIEKLATDATRPSLTQSILNKILIPLPSLEKQQEIVNILDKFETLTNSISEGLPKEIELRQKQYEYYRNLLLTFEE